MMQKNFLLILLTASMMADAFMPSHQHENRIQMSATTDCSSWWKQSVETLQKTGAAMALITVLLAPTPAFAAKVLDISGQDFSGQDLSKRDFTAAIAKGTDFHNCNLQGSVFSKANLVNADFSGADLRGVSFADAILDGAIMKNAQAQEATFTSSILDIGDMENIDLTNSLWPSKYRIMICDMDELKGKNPVTEVDSKDSIRCTDYIYKS